MLSSPRNTKAAGFPATFVRTLYTQRKARRLRCEEREAKVCARETRTGQGVRLLRVLTDCGSEYCGNLEHHEYELFLALEDIDRSKTKAKSPQTNGICERFYRTMPDEFYRVAFRKKL